MALSLARFPTAAKHPRHRAHSHPCRRRRSSSGSLQPRHTPLSPSLTAGPAQTTSTPAPCSSPAPQKPLERGGRSSGRSPPAPHGATTGQGSPPVELHPLSQEERGRACQWCCRGSGARFGPWGRGDGEAQGEQSGGALYRRGSLSTRRAGALACEAAHRWYSARRTGQRNASRKRDMGWSVKPNQR